MKTQGVPKHIELTDLSSEEFSNTLSNNHSESFRNRRIDGNVSSIQFKKIGRVSFRNCHFIGQVYISFEDLESLTFTACSFDYDFSIDECNSETTSRLRFTKCLFKDVFSLESLRNFDIYIRDCYFMNDLSVFNTHGNNRLIIRNPSNISPIRIEEKLDIQDCQFSFLKLQCVQSKKQTVFFGNKIDSLRITEGSYNAIEFEYNTITDLVIEGESKSSPLKIELLNLSELSNTGSVSISNVNVATLNMDAVTNSKLPIQIKSTTVSKNWFMCNAAPSNLICSNVDLGKSSIYFDHSFLGNCVFTNVIWPDGKVIESKEKHPSKERFSVLKESYRQLKHASIKSSNNIDSLAFYRHEMEQHRAFTKNNSEIKWEDKFILFISWIFSDHGQSFARPIAWLLGMHLLFFLTAIGLNYNGYYFTTHHDWSATQEFVGSYFYLLNPVHKLSDASSGGMLILDFFMRLSSGFFIYHIIRASRKFAKV